jgi:MHS family proline/betaine transporter-like MFS transporter
MSTPSDDRVLLAPSLVGAVGNLLEWYDFGLYGLFAPVFAHLFFPDQGRIASLIAAYSGFAIGFAARSLGAAALGHLGDRAGRRAVLVCSTVLMGFATTATAILPTYHVIGIGAPMLLLFVRVLQGFSVGGEFTGSVAYLVETAPGKRRGLAGRSPTSAQPPACCWPPALPRRPPCSRILAEVQSWAWRIPFLFGGIIATAGYLLRHRLGDAGYAPTASHELLCR